MTDSPRIWREVAADYDRTRAFAGAAEAEVPRLVARLILERGARRVLDLGCGTGRFSVPFAAAGLRVVGADRSPEMLACLVAKPGAERVHVVRCDASALPFRRVFDAVFTSHFLHLPPSLDGVTESLRRILVPGGLLVDADTTHLVQEATSTVIRPALRILAPGTVQWPKGERSRMRDLFEPLVARLGGGPVEVVPGPEWLVPRTLREVLASVRARLSSSIRVHSEERVLAAADEVERSLLAEGRDLDANVGDREGVRFLVARIGAGQPS